MVQGQMFKVIHNILVNADTRDAAMQYISAIVERNQKSAQLQVAHSTLFKSSS